MKLPSFLIIGAAKAGTTAVARYLGEHPQVFMSPLKETDYFAFDRDRARPRRLLDGARHTFPVRSLELYAAQFQDAGDARAIGEASPLYLRSPIAAERIRHELPDARLLAILRQPADRAWSAYLMDVAKARARGTDPASALALESRYVQSGFYARQLRAYFDRFPRANLWIGLHDDLAREPQKFMRQVFSFVGVDESFAPDLSRRHNVGRYPRRGWLNALLNDPAATRAFKRVAPEWLQRLARRARRINALPAPAMPAELRERLTGVYRNDIHELEELIGRDLSHWFTPPERPSTPSDG